MGWNNIKFRASKPPKWGRQEPSQTSPQKLYTDKPMALSLSMALIFSLGFTVCLFFYLLFGGTISPSSPVTNSNCNSTLEETLSKRELEVSIKLKKLKEAQKAQRDKVRRDSDNARKARNEKSIVRYQKSLVSRQDEIDIMLKRIKEAQNQANIRYREYSR